MKKPISLTSRVETEKKDEYSPAEIALRIRTYQKLIKQVGEKRLPNIHNEQELFSVMKEKFGLLPQDCYEHGTEEERLAKAIFIEEQDNKIGTVAQKVIGKTATGEMALDKPVDGEFVVYGRKKGDPDFDNDKDETGPMRLRIFRPERGPGTYFIAERFAKVFANITGFGYLVPNNVITRNVKNRVISRTHYIPDAVAMNKSKSYRFFTGINMQKPLAIKEFIELALLHGLLCDSDKGQHLGNILEIRDTESKRLLYIYSIDHALIINSPESNLDPLPKKYFDAVKKKVGNDIFDKEMPANFSSLFLQKLHGIVIPDQILSKLEKIRNILDDRDKKYFVVREQIKRFISAFHPKYDHYRFMQLYVEILLQKKVILSYSDLCYLQNDYIKTTSSMDSENDVDKYIKQYVFHDFFPRRMKRKKKLLLEQFKKECPVSSVV